ncbi:MAG: hypothetical protein E7232_11785 [Lachnospiraceae bacterium]|nr:hypothetical protein [Lachnospiraceae bacterium]
MVKPIKYLFAVMITASMLSTATFAGQWIKEGKCWRYNNGDGTYPTSSWHWIDGNNDGIAECYYFDSEGYLVTNTQIEKYHHDVNENGAMLDYDGTVMTLHISSEDNVDTISGVYLFKSGEELGAGEITVNEGNKWVYIQKKDESTITVTRYGQTVDYLRLYEDTYHYMPGEGDIIIESDGSLTIIIAAEKSNYKKYS